MSCLVRALTAGLSLRAREAVEMETPASAAMSSRRVERRLILQTLLQILRAAQASIWKRCHDDPDPPCSGGRPARDRKSTRLNSSHANISYAVFCLKKKKQI